MLSRSTLARLDLTAASSHAHPEMHLIDYALGMGGVLAPRAAAFGKRISALVANDGIYDFGVTQLASGPPDQRESFIAAVKQKEAPELERRIVEGMNRSPSAKWGGDQAGFVMGESTQHAVAAKMLRFHLRDGVAEQISCPTLVLDAEEDIYLKGQPDELYAHLTCPKTMLRFTTEEGAGAHLTSDKGQSSE
jgi:hypothetical protein